VLEGEISKPLEDRLLVPVSALNSAKPPTPGEVATQQRQGLHVMLQQKAARDVEASAEAACIPRAVREWEGRVGVCA
jgi:hypothetical protein